MLLLETADNLLIHSGGGVRFLLETWTRDTKVRVSLELALPSCALGALCSKIHVQLTPCYSQPHLSSPVIHSPILSPVFPPSGIAVLPVDGEPRLAGSSLAAVELSNPNQESIYQATFHSELCSWVVLTH